MQPHLPAVPSKMLSPHRIADARTISHNILYFRPHKHKRVVVMTRPRGVRTPNRLLRVSRYVAAAFYHHFTLPHNRPS